MDNTNPNNNSFLNGVVTGGLITAFGVGLGAVLRTVFAR